jgi:ATP-binding cassette subfamily C protein
MKDEQLIPNKPSSPPVPRSHDYSWGELTQMVLAHRRELLAANVIAVFGAFAAVPVPLLIPLLVDEVLLDQPGTAIDVMNNLFPTSWHGPVLYILAILMLTVVLRLIALLLNVWQTWQFTRISKNVIFRNAWNASRCPLMRSWAVEPSPPIWSPIWRRLTTS